MAQKHERMVKALKEYVVPKLRELGFKGSFPHFRRLGKEKIDLLTFQFDRWGGGFVIEISQCPTDGTTTYYGEYFPPKKVTAWDMHPDERFRLQPRPGSSPLDWFRFDNPDPDADIFEETAKGVLPFLDIAEKWWNR